MYGLCTVMILISRNFENNYLYCKVLLNQFDILTFEILFVFRKTQLLLGSITHSRL